MKHHIALVASVLVSVAACSSSTSTPAPSSGDAGGGGVAEAGVAADTWDSWASGFLTTYCVECHSASDTKGRDYTQKAKVEAEKDEIRCGVATAQDPAWACAAFPPAKQFPIGSGAKPSDADRARFVAWITAGAP